MDPVAKHFQDFEQGRSAQKSRDPVGADRLAVGAAGGVEQDFKRPVELVCGDVWGEEIADGF